ncbi:unnamed protein product [Zymoseptoria tritici ST99CH_1A5]|nr:unnamed protein product [Zymoseptoria tritici ST99CH_1A5]
MPNTIYGPLPNNDTDPRNYADTTHRDKELVRFKLPCKVLFPADSADDSPEYTSGRSLSWAPRDNYRCLPAKRLGELTPEDCRHFCFEDCAVYLVAKVGRCGYGIEQLYDKLYRRWYPTRAEDTDISHESFFCFLMKFQARTDSGPASVKEILDFHEALCSTLDEEIPKLPDEVPRRNQFCTAESQLHLPPAQYKLRPTFRQCVIIVRMEYEEHSIDGSPLSDRGVVIAWRQEDDAVRHECVPDMERGISREEVDGLGSTQAAFRCSLDEAMRIVVFTDPERRTMKREWHGFYREWLGESETVFVEPCRCSGCMPHLYPVVMRLRGP